MKQFRPLLIGLILLALSANTSVAQVEPSMRAERQDFLQYEPAIFELGLKNISDSDIIFAKDDNGKPWVNFIIKHINLNRRVMKEKELEIPNVIIPKFGSRTLPINITPYYTIRETGQYTIQAAVKLKTGGALVTSPLVFNIGRGSKMWEENKIVQGSKLEFSLLRFGTKSNVNLYMRVESPADNLVYATNILGPIVAFAPPVVEFDPDLTWHVLHAVGAKTYRYSMIDSHGKILLQEDRRVSGTLPRFTRNQNGLITIVGGTKPQDTSEAELLSAGQSGLSELTQ
ncbi:MAG: hypothetical protein AAF984_03200 [Verrucomicrobiota bacterium]